MNFVNLVDALYPVGNTFLKLNTEFLGFGQLSYLNQALHFDEHWLFIIENVKVLTHLLTDA